MSDALLSLALKIAFALLDRWLDSRIDRLALDGPTKERAKLLADELERALEPVVGDLAKAIAGPMVKRALARAFPNDPTTGTWAG